MNPNQKIEQQNEAIAKLVLEVAAERQRADMHEQQAKSYEAAVQAEQQRYEKLAQELAVAKAADHVQEGMIGVTAHELSCVISWLDGGRDPKDAAKELRIYRERKPKYTATLPKWIDDQKGSGPDTDALIEYIEQLRATQPVQQPAPISESHYEAGRKQGRAEALAILMQLDPEGGIDEYTGWSTPAGPEDEGSAYWEEEKLRELFVTDGALADMMDQAEAQYWQYIGMQGEAERAKNFAANMNNSGKVREVLSKAGEFDLMGQLCGAAPVAAPVNEKKV